jgi:hypothetical protein
MCDNQYEPRSIQVNAIRINLCVHPRHLPAADRLTVIETTLKCLPAEHLQVIGAGHIRLSHPDHPPQNGGGSDPAPWIRISARSLAHARGYSPTLLHEMGHVVDYHYGAMGALRTAHPQLYRVLNGTAHTGRTQFDGERFADCYMIFFLTQVAGIPYVHRAEPSAYQGDGRTTRFRALLSTPAFASWMGPLANLRLPSAPQARQH